VALVGDARAVTGQMNAALREQPWQCAAESTWRTGIAKKIDDNRATTQVQFDDDSVPMNYYRVLREIRDILPRDAIIASRRYPIHEMITHRWPLEQAQAALEDLSNRAGGHVKVVLQP
jgi:hypothetical protein